MSEVVQRVHLAMARHRTRMLANGAAIHVSAEMALDDVVALLRDIDVVPSAKSVIAVDHGGLRSSTRARLSLHQEDYHLERRPRVLCFWCERTAMFGGRTLVSSVKPAELATMTEYRQAQVRYFRRSSQEWTPWRPLLERISTEWWARIALPDAHRNVECRSGDGDAFDDLQAMIGPVEAVDWSAGDVLVIDNRLGVHGREAIGPGSRSLHRWVA